MLKPLLVKLVGGEFTRKVLIGLCAILSVNCFANSERYYRECLDIIKFGNFRVAEIRACKEVKSQIALDCLKTQRFGLTSPANILACANMVRPQSLECLKIVKFGSTDEELIQACNSVASDVSLKCYFGIRMY